VALAIPDLLQEWAYTR